MKFGSAGGFVIANANTGILHQPSRRRKALQKGMSSLRIGFTAVVALLIFSSVEAYRIQDAISERHLDIYRQYVHEDEAASNLRRTIWLSGNYVRDFFIDARPETADRLREQLAGIRSESDQENPTPTVIGFAIYIGSAKATSGGILAHSGTGTCCHVARQPGGPISIRPTGGLVRRRSSLYDAMRRLNEAEQKALQKSERQFFDTRITASRRLVTILSLSVLLAIVVAWFSFANSEVWSERQSGNIRRSLKRSRNSNNYRRGFWKSKRRTVRD